VCVPIYQSLQIKLKFGALPVFTTVLLDRYDFTALKNHQYQLHETNETQINNSLEKIKRIGVNKKLTNTTKNDRSEQLAN